MMEEAMKKKIYYREFVKRVQEEVEINSKSQIERTNELFRKLIKILKMKDLSLFEAFVLFDVN